MILLREFKFTIYGYHAIGSPSSLIIKTPERRHAGSGVFVVNFEHISPLFDFSIVDFEQVDI